MHVHVFFIKRTERVCLRADSSGVRANFKELLDKVFTPKSASIKKRVTEEADKYESRNDG